MSYTKTTIDSYCVYSSLHFTILNCVLCSVNYDISFFCVLYIFFYLLYVLHATKSQSSAQSEEHLEKNFASHRSCVAFSTTAGPKDLHMLRLVFPPKGNLDCLPV